MIRSSLLLPALLLTPVADTVWWNTEGGNVTQHRDQDDVTCTLTLENDQGRFQFVWDRNLPARITVSRQGWRNVPDQITTVAMRIGDGWLEHGNGKPNITAMTGGSAYMFILNQPIDDLLLSADDIAIRTSESRFGDSGFGMSLTRGRMQGLVTALRKCRAVISR
jgi:hypothetical protein